MIKSSFPDSYVSRDPAHNIFAGIHALCFLSGKMVKVNGINYHVLVRSLQQRKPGQPVLVFENGMGMSLGNWNTVSDSLARTTPVFFYDRQSVEKSDKVFQLPTPQKGSGEPQTAFNGTENRTTICLDWSLHGRCLCAGLRRILSQ